MRFSSTENKRKSQTNGQSGRKQDPQLFETDFSLCKKAQEALQLQRINCEENPRNS
jgi:hypothetical protein